MKESTTTRDESRQWLASKVNGPPGVACPEPVTVPVRPGQRPPVASTHFVDMMASRRSISGGPDMHAKVRSDTTRAGVETRGRMVPPRTLYRVMSFAERWE